MDTLESALAAKFSKLQYTPCSAYPLTACNYFVLFGSRMTSFSKVSELHLKSAQLMAINEGGSSQPYIVGDTKKSFNTLTFEKGYGTLDLLQNIKRIAPLTIVLKARDQSVQGVYYTNRAVLQDIVLSELNAGTSELLIQKMTFAYTTLKKSDELQTDIAKYAPQKDQSANHAAVKAATLQNKKATAVGEIAALVRRFWEKSVKGGRL